MWRIYLSTEFEAAVTM